MRRRQVAVGVLIAVVSVARALVVSEIELRKAVDTVEFFALNFTADGRVTEAELRATIAAFAAHHDVPISAVDDEFAGVISTAIDHSQLREMLLVQAARTQRGQAQHHGSTAQGEAVSVESTAEAATVQTATPSLAAAGLCGGMRSHCNPWLVGGTGEPAVAKRALLKSLRRIEVKFLLQLQQLQADVRETLLDLHAAGDPALANAVTPEKPGRMALVPTIPRPGFRAEDPNEVLNPALWSDPGPTLSGADPATDTLDERGRHCTPPPLPLPDSVDCIILFWTKFYWGDVPEEFARLMTDFSCHQSCVWTNDLRAYPKASALVFHDWEPNNWPPVRYCGQKWIRLIRESPSSRPAGYTTVSRGVMNREFDAVATYHLDSDIPYPYFPFQGDAAARGLFDPFVPWRERRTDAIVSWVARNCQDASNRRTDLVLELMEHVDVHSYGRCLHNTDFPAHAQDVLRRDYLKPGMDDVLRTYKFMLVFENRWGRGCFAHWLCRSGSC